MMKRLAFALAIGVAAATLSGCPASPESAYGFRLPDGDVQAGRVAFEQLRCAACHVTVDSDTAVDNPAAGSMTVELGGEVTKVKTYGELVTSIINPSHKIDSAGINPALMINGRSAMATAQLNQYMTVAQLVDLVAYLQPLYAVAKPTYDPYLHIYP